MCDNIKQPWQERKLLENITAALKILSPALFISLRLSERKTRCTRWSEARWSSDTPSARWHQQVLTQTKTKPREKLQCPRKPAYTWHQVTLTTVIRWYTHTHTVCMCVWVVTSCWRFPSSCVTSGVITASARPTWGLFCISRHWPLLTLPVKLRMLQSPTETYRCTSWCQL